MRLISIAEFCKFAGILLTFWFYPGKEYLTVINYMRNKILRNRFSPRKGWKTYIFVEVINANGRKFSYLVEFNLAAVQSFCL